MSDFLIFDKKSLYKRISNTEDLWRQKIMDLFNCNYILVIGSSGRVPIFDVIFSNIEKKVLDKSYLGFWIFDKKLSFRKKNKSLRNMIVPLEILKTKIPNYLLEICQRATELRYI